MSNKKPDDFDYDEYTDKMSAMETFMNDFEGEGFYQKICDAIEKSRLVEARIKKVTWETIREKIVWIILGAIGFVLLDLIRIAISNIPKWFPN